MKKFALFLPQFHEIPENNEWWGEGFTEWTNVKSAKPLYKGHIQPKHPLNGNYYNLLDKEVMKWQTELIDRYRIDGMIYYHYYFNGKLLLEKPAENLLKWRDIHQHFFFCWANHSWMRSWEGKKDLLIEQTYGNVSDWEKHFQYLIPFFKDDRYEKKDNQPLFMVFQSSFDEKEAMFNYFNKRAIEEGFNGINFVESYYGDIDIKIFEQNLASATRLTFYREPLFSKNLVLRKSWISYTLYRANRKLRHLGILKKPLVLDGKRLMDVKQQNEPLGKNVANGLCFEWDNTPRHKYRGYVITPFEKSQFMHFMDIIKNQDYLFIDAWNEWCEGMVLEPTEEDGYKYLEWIKEWTDEQSIDSKNSKSSED